VLRPPHGDQVRRLDATRQAAASLRRALDRRDAKGVARLLKRFRESRIGRRPRTALARRALTRYQRRYRELQERYADLNRQQRDLANASTDRLRRRLASNFAPRRRGGGLLGARRPGRRVPRARLRWISTGPSRRPRASPATASRARDGHPGGVAVHGDRIYTVGESNGDVAIVARRATGAASTRDSPATAASTLRDRQRQGRGHRDRRAARRRLRILASTDADPAPEFHEHRTWRSSA
jgi:hypothetical protein